MIIELKKFGTALISRQAGREALAAFRPNLKNLSASEEIALDFEGVLTFSPSWGDEFLTPLVNEFGNRIVLQRTSNPSALATLEILERARGGKFRQG